MNLSTIQLSTDPKTQQPTVATPNDRKTIIKQFQKHLQQIFEQLNKAITDKNMDEFMSILADNIKNLGVRIK